MTAFRIPVIGDVHLGPQPRQAERLASLHSITAAGLELPELGAWFYVGDLFHASSRPEDRNLLANILTAQAQRAPVVIVPGNHDQEGDLAIFGRLRTRWPIHVAELPTVLELALATGGQMAVACFPWPSEARLVQAGVPIANIRATAKEVLVPVFQALGHELRRQADAQVPIAFLAHATITGAIASNGQPQVGPGIELDGELLAYLPECPRLLGHIHRPQVLADSGACYVGSIARQDFGELEPKRWILLEGEEIMGWVDDPDKLHGLERIRTRTWSYTLTSRWLDVAGLWVVDAIVDPLSPALPVAWAVSRGPEDQTLEPPASWAGHEVKVRLRYPVALRGELEARMAEIRTVFQEAARLVIEPIAEPDKGLRSPEVAAAVTLEAKVRAWADASGTSLPGHTAEALELLTHSPREGVLADVQESLDTLTRKDPTP